MYSEALAIMDHNTVMYMMDEISKELEEEKERVAEMDAEIAMLKAQLSAMKN